jgi:hypothetical protein
MNAIIASIFTVGVSFLVFAPPGIPRLCVLKQAQTII